MLRIKQGFPVFPALDPGAVLSAQLDPVRNRIKRNTRIAVAVGSRGIAQLQEIVMAVVALLKSAGANPFIIPAMGSHGGANEVGEREILAEYGITEEALKVPIQAGMQTVSLGATEDGFEVWCSSEAMQADGLVVINRIKPHTDFDSDVVGSGLLKMLVVGLGKRQGASAFHQAVALRGYERTLQSAARKVLQSAPVLFGVGLIENQTHQIAKVALVPAEDLDRRETELLAEAKRLMPRLPFDEADLLIVDRMGKNISGTGMDPNVIGRHVQGYSSALNEPNERRPIVRRLFVRELTPETHGNGLGLGLADFTTSRLVRALDLEKTYLNVLTSLALNGAKIPIHFETDREVIARALGTLPRSDPLQARVIRIQDTLSLEHMAVSEAYTKDLSGNSALKSVGDLAEMRFDDDGNLSALLKDA